MIRTGLEFAPGTTEDTKKLVARLFQPGDLLDAYRQMRIQHGTSDLVLIASEQHPEYSVEPRAKYLKNLREALGTRHARESLPSVYAILEHQSAHKVVKLPPDSDAFWVIIERGRELPVICPIFTTPYEVAASN